LDSIQRLRWVASATLFVIVFWADSVRDFQRYERFCNVASTSLGLVSIEHGPQITATKSNGFKAFRHHGLEDALLALHEMEASASQLENSDVFQAFTASQKAQYRDALSRLRDLIHDLEQDSGQEQLAS